MHTPKYSHPTPNAQKLTPVINKSHGRFCTSCQFGVHCGECVCCKSHHLPLPDGVYQFGGDFVIIIGGEECAWSDDHKQASRSYFEMQEAELSEVLQ